MFQGKQQKWERKYSPYLVIKELPPVNYLIQKSKYSRPIISHIDKLKTWETDNPPKSWVTDDFDRRTDNTSVVSLVTEIRTTETSESTIRVREAMMT